jgi:hypothetical protein
MQSKSAAALLVPALGVAVTVTAFLAAIAALRV